MHAPQAFRPNAWPTLGVEIELQLVDQETMALRSAILDLLPRLPDDVAEYVKPEFMQCYVEMNTDVCRTPADVRRDLDAKIRVVERVADQCGVGLSWAATHPFSRWQDQEITPNERYYKLADLLRETVVRPVTFGMHVHVGVASGDRAIAVIDRLQIYLPLLLALSANSPFWHSRWTGHHAHRVEVLEGFPTGGLPPQMKTWDDYLSLLGLLQKAGFIESQRELWWDARPNADIGTVEVRICDMPPSLEGVVALTALIQCLVQQLSNEVERGQAQRDCHPVITRQNRWRACRYGLGAQLVEPVSLEAVPARLAVERLVGRLRGIASGLGCLSEIESVLELASRPNGAERQISLHEQTGDLPAMVRRLVAESRLSRREEAPAATRIRDSRSVLGGGELLSPYRHPALADIPMA